MCKRGQQGETAKGESKGTQWAHDVSNTAWHGSGSSSIISKGQLARVNQLSLFSAVRSLSPPVLLLLKALCAIHSRFLPLCFFSLPSLLPYSPAPPSDKQAHQWWHGRDYRRGSDQQQWAEQHFGSSIGARGPPSPFVGISPHPLSPPRCVAPPHSSL
ncbi:unnamed protein product [Closterium sp. Naga37s-1]|nr:unnamed protein product [Closterium sp. Naga37s-1]